MQLVPNFTRLLASTAMAALFVALPVSAQFDLSGAVTFTISTAQAQDVPGDLPPDGGPGGPGGLPPDGGPGDLPPDGGPIDPPPPPGPIDPPTDPIKPPGDGCEKMKSVDCVKPKPLVKASTSDDRDEVPSSLPVKPPVVPSAAEVAMREAKTLRCGGPCIIQVSADGKITVETSEFKIGTNKHFGVKLVLDGATVTSSQTERKGIISRPPTVETFATRQAALAFLSSIVPTYD